MLHRDAFGAQNKNSSLAFGADTGGHAGLMKHSSLHHLHPKPPQEMPCANREASRRR